MRQSGLFGMRVVSSHTGSQFESGAVNRARGTNEAVEGVEVEDGREEEGDVPHVLQLSEYQTTDDAEYDSWLLLEEAVGVPAEAATEAVEPEPGVPAEAATEAVEPEPMEVATA